jgi:2-polyprenyl-3-methyl-5-hydroxy-6-metoxy-1,4-benzoquinol methylase
VKTDLVAYYRERAKEYEDIYLKPERQDSISKASDILKLLFKDKSVLELACGTGFWTERIAEVATSIHATDINNAVIEIARGKKYYGEVFFEIADLYRINGKKFDSLFAGFIWSHIKLEELDVFIEAVNEKVEKDGLVMLMDNKYVEGSNHPVFKTDATGNTFQKRNLKDGSEHLVLKNFPTEKFLFEKLNKRAFNFKYFDLEYYWLVCYQLLY